MPKVRIYFLSSALLQPLRTWVAELPPLLFLLFTLLSLGTSLLTELADELAGERKCQ